MENLSIMQWFEETSRMLEVALCAYEVSLSGLPANFPSTRKFWFGNVAFSSSSDVERTEREISDAFFLRLKGLAEAQAKRIPGIARPDWRSANQLLLSLGVDDNSISPDDKKALGEFCALRNCIAHNDGRVDSDLVKKLPHLLEGSDVWLDSASVREWFSLLGRVMKAIYDARLA